MTTQRLPEDDDVREQVSTQIDTSFFLEAGAGAGKTRVMVDRIVQIVRRGKAQVREIVAITFTEKAAGELRMRVRQAIAEALEQTADSNEQSRLHLALEQLDGAHIETIHAFAGSLLRDRPFDARIDPNFSVLAQLAQTLDLEESWSQWIWSEDESSHAPTLEEALDHGLTAAQIREAAEQIGRHRDLHLPADNGPPPDPRPTLEQWIAQAERIVNAYRAVEPPKNLRSVEQLVPALIALRDLDEHKLADRMAQFNVDREIRPPNRYKRNADARALWDEAAEDRKQFGDAYRAQVLTRLLNALNDFVQWHAEQRRKSGFLSFDDLLLYARDLIKREPRVRRYFRDRFKAFLIDEFQDTDPLQVELIMLLASREDTDEWERAQPQPGRLFVVGDPKQSIYRFRRADIRIYQKVQRILESTGDARPGEAAVERLSVNFRSRPALVDWTNHAFSEVLDPNRNPPEYHDAQAEFNPTRPHRREQGPAVITVRAPDIFPKTGESRAAEAELLPKLIRALTDARAPFGVGGLPCKECGACAEDLPCPNLRPPGMGDIAILIRSRTGIDAYTNAFDKMAIPYHLDSGRGFFTRPEVRDLTNILMAVDDPTDEVAVMSALKSPIASASDQELFDYVYSSEGGKRARFTLEDDAALNEYDGPLRDGFERLRNLRRGLRPRSLPQFVEFVLRESRLLEAQFAAGAQGEDRAANLLMLVHRAAEFAEAQDDSLRPFVQWLAQHREQDLAESESATSEVDKQVVRILTIHQAKGLEFPIVIAPKLGDGVRGGSKIMVDRERKSFEIQVGNKNDGFQSPGFDPEREQAYTEAEYRRVLYVAATRAKDWLILPHYLASTARGGTFAEFLETPLATSTSQQVIDISPDEIDDFRPIERSPVEVPHEDLAQRWQERREAAQAAGKINVKPTTPSQRSHDEEKGSRESPSTDGDTEIDGDILPVSVRDAAIRRGQAIHRILALTDLGASKPSEALVRQIVADYRIKNPDEIRSEVQRALNTDLMRRAARSEQRHFELPLVRSQDGAAAGVTTITEGVADLVFHEPGGWVVVDFKSDRSRDSERDQRYKEQVQTYAEMLAAAGETVTEAWLLYTHTGDDVEVSLAQTETAQ